MKFIKKAAALFFCLALTLSVMAVTAAANEEAELLAGVGKQGNPEFKVTLTQVADSAILDRDSTKTPGSEINPTQTVNYDLYLAYKHVAGSAYPEFTATNEIYGFQFDYDSNYSDNHSATIHTVTMNKKASEFSDEYITIGTASTYSSGTMVRYAYTSSDGGPFKMEDTNVTVGEASDGIGVKIATLTVEFEHAHTNVAIKPTIKNIMIYVRDNQYIQIPVATPAEGKIANYEPASGDTEPASVTYYKENGHSDATVDTSDLTSVIVQPEIPVYVNPVYIATVEHFKANTTTGFAEKMTDSDTGYQTFVTYNYTTGNTGATAAAASTKPDVTGATGAAAALTVLKNEDPISGYTFQGWMVTADTNPSNSWAEYSSSTNPWTNTESYPATTERTGYTMAGVPVWKANADGETDGDSWYNTGRVELTNDTKTNVNFIKASSDTNTTILPGLVGNITLTPVYTRNVYQAEFNAGDASSAPRNSGQGKAKFGDTYNATGTAPAAVSYTKNYTIQDLYNGTAAVDYLELKDGNGIGSGAQATGPQGLNRKGFKWVGWTISGDTGTYGVVSADRTTPASGDTPAVVRYTWDTNATTTVNSVPVLAFADNSDITCKHYGDVKFTAEWELDICFAKIDYQYAGTGSMILVGVPLDATAGNYEPRYTYKCNNNAMFIIPGDEGENSTRRGGYVNAAYTATATNATNSTAYTFTSAYLTGSEGTGSYVLYAYIAASNTAESAITLTESINDETHPGNDTLVYNGNIDDYDGVNVGDFGNVNTLLQTKGANVLSIDVPEFVKARLQADVSVGDADDVDFGSIRDVKVIYNKMGYEL